MKILSIIVPCYNSEEYLERCVNLLLLGGESVEIILVNDGSTDRTKTIANHYRSFFPKQIKVVHQENGGHGEAINSGLKIATGEYVKVVDSDDWLDATSYQKILSFLSNKDRSENIDMLISNYVYEKDGAIRKKIVEYSKFMPVNKIFSWEDVRFPLGKYLLMHSVIYRTELLKEINLELPQHTFYVDNLYVFQPLTQVKNMYYLDVALYRYYIGREDQSVNETVMISRIDQQIFVNKQLINHYSEISETDENLLNYMRRYVEIVTTVSSILLIKEGTEDSLNKKKELWAFLKEVNPQLYRKLRRGMFGISVNLPGKLGRRTAVGAYRVAQRLYGFN